MAKTTRAQVAARGTRLDADREVRPARQKAPAATRPMSSYEQRTGKIFTILQVLLVVVPLALVGWVWVAGGGSVEDLGEAMREDPSITVSFISAMMQPLVAWLLVFVKRHYTAGDGGYAAANLIGLICGELLLQNAVGVLGCALVLWRIWRRIPGELTSWRQERGIKGALADLSGAIAVCVVGAVCAFATWRITMA